MNTLTVPKIKDLVNKPNEQYREIYETINKDGQAKQTQGQPKQAKQQQNEMAEELSLFLNELKKGPSASAPTGGDFYAANEMAGNGFSAY